MQITQLIKETYTKDREWKDSDSYGWISEEAQRPYFQIQAFKKLVRRMRTAAAKKGGKLLWTVNQATEQSWGWCPYCQGESKKQQKGARGILSPETTADFKSQAPGKPWAGGWKQKNKRKRQGRERREKTHQNQSREEL